MEGIIIKNQSNDYTVRTSNGLYVCKPSADKNVMITAADEESPPIGSSPSITAQSPIRKGYLSFKEIVAPRRWSAQSFCWVWGVPVTCHCARLGNCKDASSTTPFCFGPYAICTPLSMTKPVILLFCQVVFVFFRVFSNIFQKYSAINPVERLKSRGDTWESKFRLCKTKTQIFRFSSLLPAAT